MCIWFTSDMMTDSVGQLKGYGKNIYNFLYVLICVNWIDGWFVDHPELYKDKGGANNNGEARAGDSAAVVDGGAGGGGGGGGGRQAATDEFMLERFRKRERHRGTRRWLMDDKKTSFWCLVLFKSLIQVSCRICTFYDIRNFFTLINLFMWLITSISPFFNGKWKWVICFV